ASHGRSEGLNGGRALTRHGVCASPPAEVAWGGPMQHHLRRAGARAGLACAVTGFIHLVSAATALVLTGCEGGASDPPPEEQRAPARETAQISEALRMGDDCMQLRRGILAELGAGRAERAKGCRTDADCELSSESPSCQATCPTAVLKARRGEA